MQDDEDETVCRLCYDAEVDPSDPLMEPCKCSGSMAFIHQSCLFESRVNSFKPSALSECGLCKTTYRTIDTQSNGGKAESSHLVLLAAIGKWLGWRLAAFCAVVVGLGFAPWVLVSLAQLDEPPSFYSSPVLNHLATGGLSTLACVGGWAVVTATSSVGLWTRMIHRSPLTQMPRGGKNGKAMSDAMVLLVVVGAGYLAYSLVAGLREVLHTAYAASSSGVRSTNRAIREEVARRFLVVNLSGQGAKLPEQPDID